MFQSSGQIYPHPRYQPGGKYYQAEGYGSIYWGTVCKNCGYPYGIHVNTQCIIRKQYVTPEGHILYPMYIITDSFKKLKLL